MPGSKHIYLGLYNEEDAAARAYDRALVRLRGSSAATNYALANYKSELQAFHNDQVTEKLQLQLTAANVTGKAPPPLPSPPLLLLPKAAGAGAGAEAEAEAVVGLGLVKVEVDKKKPAGGGVVVATRK